MKTQQVSEKGILAQKIITEENAVLSEEKKGMHLSKKLSLRPQKSLVRKSIRPMNLFSSSKSKLN